LNPSLLLIIIFVLILIMLASGFHIAVSLMLISVVGFFIYQGNPGLGVLISFRALNNFTLVAIPLFILMGEILMRSGASERVYNGASKLLSWIPGGLLHTNIGMSALFASVSGSSSATAAIVGTVAYPNLKKRKYDLSLSLGSICGGGSLGILIPPSLNMIVYSALTGTSVAALFAGGVIPGIIISLLFMLYICVRTVLDSSLAPKEASFSIKMIPLALFKLWPFVILITIVLGGIFGGFTTPTEAAALGVVTAIIISLITRRFSLRLIKDSISSAIRVTSMILFLFVGANMLSGLFARTGIPIILIEQVVNSGFSNSAVLFFIYVVFIFLGCFIDTLSMMVLVVPTILPLLSVMHIDLLWFGIILVILCELGMLTPPVGGNLFVLSGISGENILKVAKASIPFFFIMLFSIVIFSILPRLITWFPSSLGF